MPICPQCRLAVYGDDGEWLQVLNTGQVWHASCYADYVIERANINPVRFALNNGWTMSRPNLYEGDYAYQFHNQTTGEIIEASLTTCLRWFARYYADQLTN